MEQNRTPLPLAARLISVRPSMPRQAAESRPSGHGGQALPHGLLLLRPGIQIDDPRAAGEGPGRQLRPRLKDASGLSVPLFRWSSSPPVVYPQGGNPPGSFRPRELPVAPSRFRPMHLQLVQFLRFGLSQLGLVLALPGDRDRSRRRVFRDVRPILSRYCFKCHGPDEGKREAGLRLDLHEAAIADSTPAKRPSCPATQSRAN